MKILFINVILYRHGNGIIPKVKFIKDTKAYNFALGFFQNGHEITLYAADDYRTTEKESYDFEVIFGHTKCKSIFKPTDLPYLSSLRMFLINNQKKYDLIISSEVFSLASLTALLCIPAKKLVIWHELTLHQKKFHQISSIFLHNVIFHLFMRKAFIVLRSKEVSFFISDHLKNISSDYIKHGINSENFEYKKIKKNQFIAPFEFTLKKLNEFGIPQNKLFHITTFFNLKQAPTDITCEPYFLFVGRIEKQKGLQNLIDAFINTKLILKIIRFSNNGYEEELKKSLNSKQHHIDFLGKKIFEEIEQYLRTCLCTIVPSKWYDNFPNVILKSIELLNNPEKLWKWDKTHANILKHYIQQMQIILN